MPDTVESDLAKVLKGLPLDGNDEENCDFTLEEQNVALEAQGIQPKIDPNFKPILGVTTTFIVAVVMLNENNEVLMIQEAKKTCAGKWYLPAGRMEKQETIVMAAKREVLEETGLEIECTSLLMIECAAGFWIRFVLTGKVLGGELKTPARADQESLQAKWIANIDELELRSSDIKHLIERARAYKMARQINDKGFHPDQLPALKPHTKMLLRMVIVIKKKASNRVHILISEKNSWHLPTCEIHSMKNIHSSIRKFMVDLFGAEVPTHKLSGVLSYFALKYWVWFQTVQCPLTTWDQNVQSPNSPQEA
ncbi:unnamed protein product [Brassicogethes aeneus]|uniref:Nudix hydrolase domain-containing protein n=1 Tax=Brassicogethes aeneus TaxID=1431903 RepID=A0A9P0B363_BRAAE|nr:unnamed protein product [Brassicogethes aeneus]